MLNISKFFCFCIMLPLSCFAQVNISGKILDDKDGKPIPDASVFLSNATIGSKSSSDGSFILSDIKPGKYELVVSVVGFEAHRQPVTVGNVSIKLPDIMLFKKTIELKEVSVTYKKDPNREKYYGWFKDEFLGSSDWAKECRILNPAVLDLSYDDESGKLTASSGDFLQIENEALGYKVKYLLTNFSFENSDEKKIYYEGPVLFEELKGTPAQQRRWLRNREEVYENSPMHFLRAALNDHLTEEGFRVQEYSIYANPERPPDNIINTKIAYYNELKNQNRSDRDSLAFWIKKSKLGKTLHKLQPSALRKADIVRLTDKPGQYALGRNNNWLYVAYSKNHHFHINDQIKYLYNSNNTENTLVKFNEPEALFNSSGIISNPYSVIYYGVWGRNRVAEMLPMDYEPKKSADLAMGSSSPAIDSAFRRYKQAHPLEKAYLQFDKPYYASGDTIYFKAYVVNDATQQLSDLSGVLHVDFISIGGNVLQSVKLKLDSGLAWGDFSLPDSIPAGNYHIRAYTRWMLNDGQKDFFYGVIPVGSEKRATAPRNSEKRPQLSILKPDIQFFPEGGNLVMDVRSKLAFKAIGPDGLGISATGIIADSTGRQVASFASSHLGMGYFYFTPEEGKSYTANVTYSNGVQAAVTLPKAQPGIALAVTDDSPSKSTITLAASLSYYKNKKGKDYKLVIHSGPAINTVSCKLDGRIVTRDILKRNLPSGVAVITLLSPDNEPLGERLLFINNHDQIKLNISSNKKSYARREKVMIRLDTKLNPAKGHFSVSVINEDLVPADERNSRSILSCLLLSSNLKGRVEQPNYYFTDTSLTATKNLDILMLTQGYRRFEWKQVFDSTAQRIGFRPEKGIELSGQLKSLSGRPVANGTVTLIPAEGGPLKSTTSDDRGMFYFTDLNFTDTCHFILNGVDAKGNNSTKIVDFKSEDDLPVLANELKSDQHVRDTAMTAYLKNDELQMRQIAKYFNHKTIALKQVNIRAKSPDDQYETQSLAGAGHADQVLHSAQLGSGPLVSKLNGVLRGVTFIKDTAYLTLSLMDVLPGNPPKKMLVIVDGVEGSELAGLQATDVQTVELLKNASASIYGMAGAGGVLIVTTTKRRKLDPKDIASIGVLPIAPTGYYKAREFYSPKYESGLVNDGSDLRSTIYWNPEIQTDKDGNASFEYYNADGTGTYKISVEGIDENGNIARQVYRYQVN